MQQDQTRIWRSLLQLSQATYAVLEREVPEAEGLPTNGFAVLRLLRWHGEKTLSAIAAFVGLGTSAMRETMYEMVNRGLVRGPVEPNVLDSSVFELAPLGVESARRIFDIQRTRIQRCISRLPEGQLATVATLLETLAYELAADSTGFGITCAECWAMDAQACLQPGAGDHCAFRRAQRADFDPDLGEGPDDCPSACSQCPTEFINVGVDIEEAQ